MKTVIITGVSRGLGESLAHDLLKRQFAVVGVGRANRERLHGERYRFVRCDLADAADIDATLAVRPGIIDTEMQAFTRSQTPEMLPSVGMFQGFHRGGQLVAPDVVTAKIVEKLLLRDVEPGRTYVYKEL